MRYVSPREVVTVIARVNPEGGGYAAQALPWIG
jgi:hypothetical protein